MVGKKITNAEKGTEPLNFWDIFKNYKRKYYDQFTSGKSSQYKGQKIRDMGVSDNNNMTHDIDVNILKILVFSKY